MSQMHSGRSEQHVPGWLSDLLGGELPLQEGATVEIGGRKIVLRNGILRADLPPSDTQKQTQESFAFIWSARDRFQGDDDLALMGDWYREMYGDVGNAPWWVDYGEKPMLLDAGCGAGISALGLFGSKLRELRYLGVDISTAVEAAAQRFESKGIDGAFLQASLLEIPIPDASVDVIFSQGVLHHTDSTRAAIQALAQKLKSGGRFLFYVYKKKGPIREYTDDFIREKLQLMSSEQAWEAMLPLTKFGQYLGNLKIEIDVPEAIDLLDIPAGKIDLQRFFYWHLFKAFHHTTWNLDELNHINLDWYAPVNAHRQTPEEVRAWCSELGLSIEREHLQESGITIIARKVRIN
jgi:arsenite methyltransferase